MVEIAKASTLQNATRAVRRIQLITVIWMSAEAALALYTAWMARSPALLAFGGDSFVELFSALVVFWRFITGIDDERAERRAAQIAGALLFALAAFVGTSSFIALVGHKQPQPTRLGIATLFAAAIFMPWLASKKHSLALITRSSALKADAAESAMCGYLALIALSGLVCNAIWHISWADPAAALCLLPFIVREGWEAVQGRRDCC